jgi:hypothetical protein
VSSTLFVQNAYDCPIKEDTVHNELAIPGGTRTVFGDHEVVLTKTFEQGGKTWYEMEDPSSPATRYFVTPEKLNNILQEKGVAFGRNP